MTLSMRRTLHTDFEFKRVTNTGEFEGYASIFDQVDLGQDTVVKGAFARSLAERGAGGVKLLWQHDPTEPIGVFHSIEEDETGLYVRGRLLLDLKRAKEAHALMQASALDGLSIGYHTLQAEYDEESGIRRLLDVDLWEISLVTFPMQREARISSFKAAPIRTIRQFENFLRDAGSFSRAEAKAIAARGFASSLHRREADGTGNQSVSWGDVLESLHRAREAITR